MGVLRRPVAPEVFRPGPTLLEFRSVAEPSRKYLLPLPELLPKRFYFPLVASNLHIEFRLLGADLGASEFGSGLLRQSRSPWRVKLFRAG